jgi:small subunit ribosomal protein S16
VFRDSPRPVTEINYKRQTKGKIMAVKLRMTRIGRRHRPFFRINAIESRTPRDGRIIEKLGHYDPIEKDPAKQIVLNLERIQYWLDHGAVPSDAVSQILLRQGIKHKYAEESAARRARARAVARAKGRFFTKAERVAAEKAADEKAKAEAEAKAAEEKAAKEAKAEAEKAKAEAEKAKAEAEKPKPEPTKEEPKEAKEPETEPVAEEKAPEEAKAEPEAKEQVAEEPKPEPKAEAPELKEEKPKAKAPKKAKAKAEKLNHRRKNLMKNRRL